MAYTAITVQNALQSGPSLTYSNGVAGGAGTGYKFTNDGHTALLVKNTSAVNTPNVVVVTGGSADGNAISDVTVAQVASTDKLLGPFPKPTYDQSGSDEGMVYVYFSGGNETDLRIAAIRV